MGQLTNKDLSFRKFLRKSLLVCSSLLPQTELKSNLACFLYDLLSFIQLNCILNNQSDSWNGTQVLLYLFINYNIISRSCNDDGWVLYTDVLMLLVLIL